MDLTYLISKTGKLISNKTKNLSSDELAYIKANSSFLPENATVPHRVYVTMYPEKATCSECNNKVITHFVSFIRGYKIPLCKTCTRKLVTTKARKTIKETTGNILEKDDVLKHIEFLENSNLRVDKWTQHTRAHYKDEYTTVKELKQKESLRSWTEALYWFKHNITEHPLCPCSRKQKLQFRNFNRGYAKHCSKTSCQHTDKEENKKRYKNISCSALKKSLNELLKSDKPLYMYTNYMYYKDPKRSNGLFALNTVSKLYKDLEEFDLEVPVYSFIDNNNFKERYYYFFNNLTEPKTCKCCSRPINISSTYCLEHGGLNNPYSAEKFRKTNLERTGYEYPSQRPEHKEALRERLQEENTFVGSSKQADTLFHELANYCIDNLSVSKENIYVNNFTKEYFVRTKKRFMLYDFVIKTKDVKICIEFNGSHVHANPEMSPSDWLNWESAFSKESADVVHNKDVYKIKSVKDKGFETLVIWDSDYSLEMCVGFIEDVMLEC